MNNDNSREPLLEMFIFETLELSDQLEQLVLSSEKTNSFESAEINEIFRIMHTIKGSASMMFLDNISVIAHAMEDLFQYLRESEVVKMDYSKLCDLILKGIDFIKREVAKLESNKSADGNPDSLLNEINSYLKFLQANSGSTSANEENIKPAAPLTTDEETKLSSDSKEIGSIDGKTYKTVIFFEEGCEMENIRAFNVVHKLKEIAHDIKYLPANIEDDDCISIIRQEGFKITFTSDCNQDEMETFFSNIAFVKSLDVAVIEKDAEKSNGSEETNSVLKDERKSDFNSGASLKQNMISVQLNKLDKLLDLVGELVISGAMVIKNPDLAKIQDLDNFNKAVRQHRKVINEIQDVVMSIRMVPLAGTFHKMNRIVRDMSKKLNKQVELEIHGEETEVDKNIIQHLADPLMHIIRNAVDHGIELASDRLTAGKPAVGKIQMEAKNEGGDVWITIKDDGGGIDKKKILSRAFEQGLVNKIDAELSDREVYAFILLPGFSTNTEVNEYSGRGVGMDVVTQNIEEIGGSVYIDSKINEGTTISLKIPLTLAIIEGMEIKVGNSVYILPITSIRESFKAREGEVFTDPNGQEMIMVRGECLPILRLHEIYRIDTAVQGIHEGIIMITETGNRSVCLFADELLGEQQVVVKALPKYLKKIKGIGGCTLLGDGTSSLILDVAGLVNYYAEREELM